MHTTIERSPLKRGPIRYRNHFRWRVMPPDHASEHGFFDRSFENKKKAVAYQKRVKAKFQVITFSSDWLYPAHQSQDLVQTLTALGRSVEYHHVHAPFGHDSFLVEVEKMSDLVGTYLDRLWQDHKAATR